MEDMPDKFEREKIDLHFERNDLYSMELIAARILNTRPNLTFRKMAISLDPIEQKEQLMDLKANLTKQIC